MPTHVWEIEAENFAWIDFFWSTMGRSGDAGQDVELIYEKMQDPKELEKLLSTLSTNLAKRYDLPGWGDTMEAKLLKLAFNGIAAKIAGRERTQTTSPLGQDAEKGLWAYMNGPLREQIDIELTGNMPSEVTFVFGHTHKPFQGDMNFKGYPQWVNVYNTGGWVVETVKAEPLHGGAIVLVDENLDAISLRMYNESDSLQGYSVGVEQAKHPGDPDNPLFGHICKLVERKDKADLWKGFSDTVARAVSVRAQNLRARINEKA